MKKYNLGYVAGILFSLIFGFSFMFSKIVLDSNYTTPMGLIAYRFLLAFIVFEVLRLTKVVKIRFDRRFFLPIFLVALFQPILYFIFETYGLDLTTSAEGGLMIALIPIFVTILSSFVLNEKPNKIQILFIALSFVGVILIQVLNSEGGSLSSLWGFLLLLLAVISAALFNIASRSASKKVKPFELTYFMMLYGAVTFNIIYLFQLGMNNTLSEYFSSLINIEVLGPILYLGIVASIGGFFLVNFALSKLPAHVSSIYANISTIVAVLAGYFFLNESLYWYHFVGGLLIVVGVYGTARANNLNKSIRDDTND